MLLFSRNMVNTRSLLIVLDSDIRHLHNPVRRLQPFMMPATSQYAPVAAEAAVIAHFVQLHVATISRDGFARDGDEPTVVAAAGHARLDAVKGAQVPLSGGRALPVGVADEHAEHGDAGGDDGRADLGVAPDVEGDAVGCLRGQQCIFTLRNK